GPRPRRWASCFGPGTWRYTSSSWTRWRRPTRPWTRAFMSAKCARTSKRWRKTSNRGPQAVARGDRNEDFPGRPWRPERDAGRPAGAREMSRLLERVSVRDPEAMLNRPVEKLSGGELQRILMGLAMHPQPELLLLDEPAAGIDFQDQEKFYGLIARLNEETGV